MRNYEVEKEMNAICTEVWSKIGIGKMPTIESKQGGSTGVFYPDSFKVIFRTNCWNKMPLAGKRMIAIHELYHALGRGHNSGQMFCHSYDILTIEIYKALYGEDVPYQQAKGMIQEIISDIFRQHNED